jgi:hypothetical protein
MATRLNENTDPAKYEALWRSFTVCFSITYSSGGLLAKFSRFVGVLGFGLTRNIFETRDGVVR